MQPESGRVGPGRIIFKQVLKNDSNFWEERRELSMITVNQFAAGNVKRFYLWAAGKALDRRVRSPSD
jgi:hypothetical protein